MKSFWLFVLVIGNNYLSHLLYSLLEYATGCMVLCNAGMQYVMSPHNEQG